MSIWEKSIPNREDSQCKDPGACLMCWRMCGFSRVSLENSIGFQGGKDTGVWGARSQLWALPLL